MDLQIDLQTLTLLIGKNSEHGRTLVCEFMSAFCEHRHKLCPCNLHGSITTSIYEVNQSRRSRQSDRDSLSTPSPRTMDECETITPWCCPTKTGILSSTITDLLWPLRPAQYETRSVGGVSTSAQAYSKAAKSPLIMLMSQENTAYSANPQWP